MKLTFLTSAFSDFLIQRDGTTARDGVPRFARVLVVLGVTLLLGSAVFADDKSDDAKSKSVKQASEDNSGDDEPASSKAHLLRYRFADGQQIRSKVVHLVTVETRIQGTTQIAKTRSVSTKAWKIKEVDEDGLITFIHSVDDVDMWQSVTGRQVIRYNSRKDKEAPVGYETVAESVGVPLSTVTIDTTGRVKERKDNRNQFNPGIGELTVPLPKEAVHVGHRWTEADELRIGLPGEPVKRIKTRQVYRLRKVQNGVATIDVKTEVLTPVDDPAIQAQLVQRLQQGTIKFDLDAGRLMSRQMDMDETVIGFNGAESQMEYLARFSEEMLDGAASSASSAEPPVSSTERAARREAGPVRR